MQNCSGIACVSRTRNIRFKYLHRQKAQAPIVKIISIPSSSSPRARLLQFFSPFNRKPHVDSVFHMWHRRCSYRTQLLFHSNSLPDHNIVLVGGRNSHVTIAPSRDSRPYSLGHKRRPFFHHRRLCALQTNFSVSKSVNTSVVTTFPVSSTSWNYRKEADCGREAVVRPRFFVN